MANEREQAMEYEMNEFSRRIEMPLGEGQKQAFRAGWSNAFRYAAATAEGIPQADGWVAIETVEDLPKEEGLRCLVTRRGHVELLVWCDHYKSWDDATGDDHECDAMDVTAWQPLPAPYQRKSEGDSE